MQDNVITVQQSTQGGFEVCWVDGGPLMRIFDSASEALEHANMIADQAHAEGGFMCVNNKAA